MIERQAAIDMMNIAIDAISVVHSIYDYQPFYATIIRRQEFLDLGSACAIAWADMIESASRRDGFETQSACCAVYACRCALEVSAWIKQPTLSGEQRIYNLLAMTRAKAEEARMLAGG
jgi:hypothetical protein